MKTCREYRREAKAALKGQWGMAILIMLVYGFIFTTCTATAIGAILLGGALTVGCAIAFMEIIRGQGARVGSIFSGFDIDLGSTIGLYVKEAIFLFLWSLLLVFPAIIKAYAYSMAPYILADHPVMGGGQAITASRNLMRGKKWQLFCLDLSFIGWDLLSILTLGILQLWITPWKQAARAAFYESIKNESVAY